MDSLKAVVFSVVSVILIISAPILFIGQASDKAVAVDTQTCPVVAGVKEGNTLIITACDQTFTVDVNRLANGSLELGSIVLPPGQTITLPPVTLPPATVTLPPVKVPGPTEIIRIPGPTQTVRVPLPGETATVRIPGPTETVTVRPNNPEPSELPRETVTVTAEPTGQPTPSRATVTETPEPETETVTETETRTQTETIVRNIVLGTLALLALAALGILALWLGYILGYKGAERKEARSLRGLLDVIKSSR